MILSAKENFLFIGYNQDSPCPNYEFVYKDENQNCEIIMGLLNEDDRFKRLDTCVYETSREIIERIREWGFDFFAGKVLDADSAYLISCENNSDFRKYKNRLLEEIQNAARHGDVFLKFSVEYKEGLFIVFGMLERYFKRLGYKCELDDSMIGFVRINLYW